MSIPIFSNPDDITPEWLTSVLAPSGIKGKVDDFSAQSIGTGQVGENVRFKLEGDGLPDSIVGKFPSADPTSRATGIQLQNYTREVFYYQTIDDTVDIQTPRIYFADINKDTHDFVIIMEDLAPGEQGDQLGGCNVDQAALALEQLAKLQGPRWGDASLSQYPLLSNRRERPADGPDAGALYKMVEPGFIERYQSHLSDAQIKLVAEVGGQMNAYETFYEGPLGLVHVDYRLDNMMFGGPYPLAVVDWQSISLGCPIQDASYFLGTSLLPEDRREEEAQLLKLYLGVLKSYKVDINWDECFACYRHFAPAGLIMAVIASMIVGETERGNEMFMAMATRSAALCLDYA